MRPQRALVIRGVERLAAILLMVTLLGMASLAAPGSLYAQELSPFIERVEPPEGRCGQQMSLTIYGGNFDPASEATILVDGVEIFYTRFISPEELQVGLYITEGAPDGSWPVAVLSPEGGETVLEGGFTIICPSGGEGPSIERVEPPEGRCDRQMDLTIYGGNFAPASEAAILVDGVEIFYTEFIGPEELQVGLYIAEDAPEGSWPVVVFSPEGGEAVLEGGFTIICPSGGEPPPEEPTEGPPEQPPGPPEEPGYDGGGGPGWLLLIVIIGTVGLALVGGVGGGIILSRRRVVRMRKREQWQEKAQEGDPPEPCQPPGWYCKKEPEVELKRSKLTDLTLLARAPGTGRDRREVGGRLARDLDRVVVAYRLGKRLEELRSQIDTLAAALAREIVAWVQGETSSQEVAIDATFEGAEFTVTFTLYRCVQKGPLTEWEEADGWQVSYQHEYDAPVGTLFLQNPAEVGLVERITPDVSRLLIQFVQRS